MKTKPVVPRGIANRDVEEAVDHYLAADAADAALAFVDALERSYAQLSRHPASGSSRYADPLDLPGLRSWPLKGFPYLIFCFECDDRLDVWRVLHGRRDIPWWLQDEG